MKEKAKRTTLGLAERLGFGAISIADNLRSYYQSTFMLFFFTNVLGCRPGIIATLMSICTVWDAINDPMIASYADNHPNRKGERTRQYLFASIPLGILAGLVLHLPAFWIYFFMKIDRSSICLTSVRSLTAYQVSVRPFRLK